MGQTAAEIWRFFDFSKIAAVRYLGFVMRVFSHPRRTFGVFIAVQNLVGIGAVVLILCVYRVREFGLKTPIHAPKIVFWGQIGEGVVRC